MYAAPGPVCRAHAASPPPAARLVAQPPPARRVCHVQDGKTPLHYAAAISSEAVVLALLAAYPEAAKATDKVRRPQPCVFRDHATSSPPAARLVAQPPPARRVCHVQDGWTPLHRAANYSSSVAVVQGLYAMYPEAVKATNKVRRPGPCVPRSWGLSPTRRPPCRSAAPLLAVCAPYRTGRRHSTSPLSPTHRRRWCRRCLRRTRRPPRRRTRYAAPGPVCRAHAASHPPAARLVAQPPLCSPCVPRTERAHASGGGGKGSGGQGGGG